MLTTLALAASVVTSPRLDTNDKLLEAMTSVVEGTRQAIEKGDFGFRPGACILGAYLEGGKSVSYSGSFAAGKNYVVVAGGDTSATDIDVKMTDGKTKVYAKDDTEDPAASVAFSPTAQTSATIVVTNPTKKPAMICAAVIVDSGGWNIAPENVNKLIENTASIGELIKKEGYSWAKRKNSWCVLGSVLKQGESFAPFLGGFPAGDYTIMSFGDGQATKMTLEANDGADFSVKSDDGDAVPGFDLPSGFSASKLNLKLTNKKGDPSLSVIAIVGKK